MIIHFRQGLGILTALDGFLRLFEVCRAIALFIFKFYPPEHNLGKGFEFLPQPKSEPGP
jgi:hypothetical protein